MKTNLLTICALLALAGIANAQQTTPNTDLKKPAPVPQAPTASGTTNGGDVDRAVPKTDHGTQKTAGEEKNSKDPTTKPESKENTKLKAGNADPSDTENSKATDRDHGVDKATHQAPKDGTDPTKDVRTEDKSKTDKVTDHQHGTEKQKN